MGLFADTLALVSPESRLLQEGPLPITAARVVEWLSGPASSTGAHISPDTAMRIGAVYDCVRLISEDVASLPLITYRRLPAGGKDRALLHPLYALLRDVPNPHMTAMQMRETLQGHLLLRGNAYANIERDPDTGSIIWLWPLHPERMDKPVLSAAGTLLYTYRLPSGEPRSLRQDEVLHLRGLSADGIMGYAPITLHRETLANAQATLEYGNRMYANDARPGGVLQTDKRLSEDAAKRLLKSWNDAHQGMDNRSRVAVLEEGVTWQTVAIAPEEAQYLESRKFNRTEIAGLFRVPPHKIGDLERATFSNIEEQAIEYVTDTLQAWLVRWEQQCNKDLLTSQERRQYFVEHLVDAKLRGKTLERMQAYQLEIQNGIMSPNEARERENMNPFEGGDTHLQPLNMIAFGTVQPAAPQRTLRLLREARCPQCDGLMGRNVDHADFDCRRCKLKFEVRDGILAGV